MFSLDEGTDLGLSRRSTRPHLRFASFAVENHSVDTFPLHCEKLDEMTWKMSTLSLLVGTNFGLSHVLSNPS